MNNDRLSFSSGSFFSSPFAIFLTLVMILLAILILNNRAKKSKNSQNINVINSPLFLGSILIVLSMLFAFIIICIDLVLKLNFANGAAGVGGIVAAIIVGRIYASNKNERMPWDVRLRVLACYVIFNVVISAVFIAVAGVNIKIMNPMVFVILFFLLLFYSSLLYFALGRAKVKIEH